MMVGGVVMEMEMMGMVLIDVVVGVLMVGL